MKINEIKNPNRPTTAKVVGLGNPFTVPKMFGSRFFPGLRRDPASAAALGLLI
jgi:hypothetical protein